MQTDSNRYPSKSGAAPRPKVPALLLGNTFHPIPKLFRIFLGRLDSVMVFQQVADATLTRLRVDAVSIMLIAAPNVPWVRRQIGNIPQGIRMFFSNESLWQSHPDGSRKRRQIPALLRMGDAGEICIPWIPQYICATFGRSERSVEGLLSGNTDWFK